MMFRRMTCSNAQSIVISFGMRTKALCMHFGGNRQAQMETAFVHARHCDRMPSTAVEIHRMFDAFAPMHSANRRPQ